MPEFLDFLFVFGIHSGPRDLRFSGFRDQVSFDHRLRTGGSGVLGRSGRRFELCYNLKSVVRKSQDEDDIGRADWSIRQVCVNHQFDVETGRALWITVKGAKDLQQRYKELTGADSYGDLKDFDCQERRIWSSLATHLMYAHWSTEGWRDNIEWLEKIVDRKASRTTHSLIIVYLQAQSEIAVHAPREPGRAHNHYLPSNIQEMQGWQDKTLETLVALESNLSILSSLKRFYTRIIDHPGAPESFKKDSRANIELFVAHVTNIEDNLRMHVARAKLLAGIIGERKVLVRHCLFECVRNGAKLRSQVTLHLQGQAAERTETLTQRMEREAIVMRIVTLVTLIYLPATFVSVSAPSHW